MFECGRMREWLRAGGLFKVPRGFVGCWRPKYSTGAATVPAKATSSRQLGQTVLCFTTPRTQGWARTRSYHLPLRTPLAVLLLQETLTFWWWLKKKRFRLHRLSAQLRMTARKWSKPLFPGVLLGTHLLRYHLFLLPLSSSCNLGCCHFHIGRIG